MRKAHPGRSGLERALRLAEARCEAMQEVGRRIATMHDLDELLRTVMSLVTRITGADRSTVFLLDAERGELWSKVAEGSQLQEIRVPLGTGVAGWVAKTGEPLSLKDAYKDPRFDREIDRRTGYRTRSLLCVPLQSRQGQALGAIESLNKAGGPFSEEDQKLLEAIACQVAIAIENAQMVLSLLMTNSDLIESRSDLSRKVRELEVLFDLEKEIANSPKFDAMLENLLKKAVSLLDCEAASILRKTADAGDLVFISAVGPAKDRIRRLRVPRGSGVVGWVAEHGETALVNDAAHDPRHLAELARQVDFPVRNILSVPVAVGGRLIGAVEFLNKRAGAFDDEDGKTSALIAGRAAAAIQIGLEREEAEKSGRLSSIGQMLSGVLHDFRTPMSIISGNAQLMAHDADPAERLSRCQVIMKQFEFMGDMTRELLAFAKGETSLLLHKVQLQRVLKEMEEVLSQELALNKVTLTMDLRFGGSIRADENKLRRMVFNLARNAREAMPRGGVFSILAEEDGGGVRLDFQDNGPGIAPEIKDRLFESFATHGKESGTGLGLAVVKSIVDEHGGRVSADDAPGGGARFRVWLPLNPPVSRKSRPKPPEQPRNGGPS